MDRDPLSPLLPDDRSTGDPSTPIEASDPSPTVPEPVPAGPASWMTGDPAVPPPPEAAPSFPTIDPSPTSAPKSSGPRKGIAAVCAAIAAILGVFAVKFVIGSLVAGAAASAIGSVFGGPWDHLPTDVKAQLNQRVNSAVGDSAKGLSDADKIAKVSAMGQRGLSRLDDAALLRRVQLYKVALDASDEATCAAVFRSSIAGSVADADAEKLIGTFTTEQFGEWVEIWVQGVEAEARNAPPARTVSDADSDSMFQAMFSAMPDEDFATIQALSAGTVVTDAAACQANRSLYSAGLTLDDANLALFALTDAAP